MKCRVTTCRDRTNGMSVRMAWRDRTIIHGMSVRLINKCEIPRNYFWGILVGTCHGISVRMTWHVRTIIYVVVVRIRSNLHYFKKRSRHVVTVRPIGRIIFDVFCNAIERCIVSDDVIVKSGLPGEMIKFICPAPSG